MCRLLVSLLAAGFGSACACSQTALPHDSTATNAPSRFRSAEDGWFDVSGFLDEEYGFLPVVIPIKDYGMCEPALKLIQAPTPVPILLSFRLHQSGGGLRFVPSCPVGMIAHNP